MAIPSSLRVRIISSKNPCSFPAMIAAEMGHTFEVEGFPRGHMSKGKQSTKELWESNLLPFMGENAHLQVERTTKIT